MKKIILLCCLLLYLTGCQEDVEVISKDVYLMSINNLDKSNVIENQITVIDNDIQTQFEVEVLLDNEDELEITEITFKSNLDSLCINNGYSYLSVNHNKFSWDNGVYKVSIPNTSITSSDFYLTIESIKYLDLNGDVKEAIIEENKETLTIRTINIPTYEFISIINGLYYLVINHDANIKIDSSSQYYQLSSHNHIATENKEFVLKYHYQIGSEIFNFELDIVLKEAQINELE